MLPAKSFRNLSQDLAAALPTETGRASHRGTSPCSCQCLCIVAPFGESMVSEPFGVMPEGLLSNNEYVTIATRF